MTTATAASRISSKPGVRGGEACIDGTRIMIWLLVYLRRRGRSDAALLDDYPGLTPADLDAAWDYYRRNPLEIEQAVWRNTVAADHEPGAPVLAWVVVVARLIGLTDDQIRDAFDPPLDPARLDAAWEEYRRHPEQIDRRIAQNRVAASEDRPKPHPDLLWISRNSLRSHQMVSVSWFLIGSGIRTRPTCQNSCTSTRAATS